jgi:hypothetical protein
MGSLTAADPAAAAAVPSQPLALAVALLLLLLLLLPLPLPVDCGKESAEAESDGLRARVWEALVLKEPRELLAVDKGEAVAVAAIAWCGEAGGCGGWGSQ